MRKNHRSVVRVGLQAFEFSRASQHEKDVLDRPIEDKLLTRGELAERWKYSTENVKRREREDTVPDKTGWRFIRYRMSQQII